MLHSLHRGLSVKFVRLEVQHEPDSGVVLRVGSVARIMTNLMGTKSTLPLDFVGWGFVVYLSPRVLIPTCGVEWALQVISNKWWEDDGLTRPLPGELGTARAILLRDRPDLLPRGAAI